MAQGSRSSTQVRLTPLGGPLTGHTIWVWAVAALVLPDGTPIAVTGSHDATVRVWDLTTRTPLGAPLTGHTSWVLAVAALVLPDGTPIAVTGSEDATVRVWDLTTGTPLGDRLTGHTGSVGAVAALVLPDGTPIAVTGSHDATVRVWDLTTRTPLGDPLTGHTRGVWAVAALVLPDGTPIAVTGSTDGTVRVWDLTTRTPLGDPLTGHTDTVWAVAALVLPDGTPIAVTGSGDGTVRVWDLNTGTLLGPLGDPLTGHTNTVWAVAALVLPDGTPIAVTGSPDRTVRVWDLTTRTPLGDPLTGHTDAVGAVAALVLPDGTPIAVTGSHDATVRVWEVVAETTVPRALPGYRSDTVAGRDLLDRRGEAVAIADLVTARSAQPPLAVGIFGQWGEGKSQFLHLVHEQVAARAAAVGAGDPVTHRAVRQVTFNAWHYAESDLWASLVAELFAQLSHDQPATADPQREARQRSRLTSDLVDARGLRAQLAGAQARLTDLQQARQTGPRPALPADTRGVAEAVRRTGSGTVKAADAGATQALEVTSALARTARAVGQAVAAIPRRWWLALVGVLVAVVVVGGLVGVGVEHGWWATAGRWLLALPGLAAVAALVGAVRAGWQESTPAREQAQRAWQATLAWTERRVQRLDTAIAVAQAEVDQLTGQLQNLTAAGQLAGLVTERAGAGRYRERLGLMTQIRADFETMADLLLAASNPRPGAPPVAVRDEVGDQLPAIERIVLYVDDLDRCPPERVVEVLEAVHLLLAGRLFVVVVAVDPRWLLSSITSHYQALFRPPTSPAVAAAVAAGGLDPSWVDGPAQYLEKIFQIVLTLPPLAESGYQQMIDQLVGVRADTPTSPTDDAPADDAPDDDGPGAGVSKPGQPSPTTAARRWEAPTLRARRLRQVERVDPLALTPDERALMGLLGPPLITSPRAVKRLANSYGLLAAIQQSSPAGRRDLQPDPDDPQVYPYRAAMVLLGAVIGFPDLGPVLFPTLYHAAHQIPDQTWLAWVTSMRATPPPPDQPEPPGSWQHPAEGAITATRAARWTSLVTALRHLDAAASNADLPLPRRVMHWQPWVIPIGRLSFPTGPAVVHLTPEPTHSPGRTPTHASTP